MQTMISGQVGRRFWMAMTLYLVSLSGIRYAPNGTPDAGEAIQRQVALLKN
jgi:hypothetical protein